MDLFDIRGGTITLTSAALALGAGTTQYTTTGTQTFAINGRLYTTVADTGVEVPDTDALTGAAFVALANGDQCLFVFGWLASGEMGVVQGPVVTTADVVDTSAVLDFPAIPATLCPFAYASVANANASAWTFGTTNWDGGTTTIGTVVNVALLPTQPLTAASA